MAKEKITDTLQAKFDKPHFQIGSAVFFSWLGSKKYGYVTAIKKTNWGVQYTVQSTKGTSYPCGISIEGTTTSYKVGIIFLEETKKLGNDEISRRIGTEIENTRMASNTRRPTVSSTTSDPGVGKDANIDNTPTANKSGSNRRAVHSDEPGNTRVSKRNTKTRKDSNSTLDNAIEKQKNFLNGFIKKD